MLVEKVVIIIPTYNEAEVIEGTLHALHEVCNNSVDFDIQVLVFDSASTDNTPMLVRKMQTSYNWLHMQTEKQKSGLGSAYLQAMRYALDKMSADLVIEFDADLSHQPKYLLPMLEISKKCDVVLGSRYVKGGSIPKNWGLHRKIISVFGNVITILFLTFKYKDFTSGFRVTRRQFLSQAL